MSKAIKPPSTYTDTVDFLYSQLPMFQRQGNVAIKKSLDNIIALCDRLGNPQEKFKSIHIAGTNGKGSVTHALAAMLSADFDKVGIYTSPHLKDYRERIKIGDRYIEKSSVVDFVRSNFDCIQEIQPSFFEITVAMAFWYFAEEKVDIAVIETGLGGRLDSTNIITPILSVITNIDLDHTEFLGDTLQEIAGEKAGIIKQGVPVIIGRNQVEVFDVFRQKANKEKAQIYRSNDVVTIDHSRAETIQIQTIEVNVDGNIKAFSTDLVGEFQLENLQTAIASYVVLSQQGVVHRFDEALLNLQDVKTRLHFHGRWHILRQKPLVIADGAHNQAAIKWINQQLRDYPAEQMHFVLGFVKEKDVEKILRLFPADGRFYLTQAQIPRAMGIDELGRLASTLHLDYKLYKKATTALKKAMSSAGPNDMVFVGGSLYILAEIL